MPELALQAIGIEFGLLLADAGVAARALGLDETERLSVVAPENVVHVTSAKLGDKALGVEGQESARWILVDLGDVIVHLFREDAREFFGLERLWGEAEAVELPRVAGAAR